MRVATWNINGVKARIEGLLTWLKETSPDVVCLQEIKTVDEGFPRLEIEALGYNVAVFGQKGFNGVALLSKLPLNDVSRGLPGDGDDEQSRYIEGVVEGAGGIVRIAGLYLPNGNPLGTEKFSYKLAWMRRLIAHTTALLRHEEPLIVLGDFNVIPDPVDAKTPSAWTGDALYQPESRALYAELRHLGLVDGIRACHPGAGVYTFWDYQAGAFQKNNGIRIDHLLLSPQAADRMTTSGIDTFTRAWEKPSDHCPAWVELSI
ncbi:MAG: exodeoxyribonuclease III [Hyphomicrobiaceae bacterium]